MGIGMPLPERAKPSGCTPRSMIPSNSPLVSISNNLNFRTTGIYWTQDQKLAKHPLTATTAKVEKK